MLAPHDPRRTVPGRGVDLECQTQPHCQPKSASSDRCLRLPTLPPEILRRSLRNLTLAAPTLYPRRAQPAPYRVGGDMFCSTLATELRDSLPAQGLLGSSGIPGETRVEVPASSRPDRNRTSPPPPGLRSPNPGGLAPLFPPPRSPGWSKGFCTTPPTDN